MSGRGQSTPVGSAFASPLIVSPSSPSGEPVAGGRVVFSAPSTGASAALAGNPATVGAEGRVSVPATANGFPGNYRVMATVPGTDSAGLTLTNAPAPLPPSLMMITPTTTRVTSSPGSSAVGRSVTFTAAVSAAGSGTPTGSITFLVDGVAQSPVPLAAAGSGLGTVAFTTTALPVGFHTVTAAYRGDAASAPSASGALVHAVYPPGVVVGGAGSASTASRPARS